MNLCLYHHHKSQSTQKRLFLYQKCIIQKLKQQNHSKYCLNRGNQFPSSKRPSKIFKNFFFLLSPPKRCRLIKNISEAIGNTPIVKLFKLPKKYGIEAEILVKCEFLNAGGSVKDRIAKKMIEMAENDGKLKVGYSTVIEPTSGNFNEEIGGNKKDLIFGMLNVDDLNIFRNIEIKVGNRTILDFRVMGIMYEWTNLTPTSITLEWIVLLS
ncbi:hypothetical protein ACQ4LE_003009 [Meloidogyne hapla]